MSIKLIDLIAFNKAFSILKIYPVLLDDIDEGSRQRILKIDLSVLR